MDPVNIKNVPQKPGVYFLKNQTGKILYVGKAIKLRSRLQSHFRPGSTDDPKHAIMMKQVVDFEIIVTDSEVEALILEANLVKEHRPKYNVDLKDDKSYPYIRVTHELYPRIFITRNIVQDQSQYFGPYTDVGSLRQLMNAVRKIFPLRTCQLQITKTSIQNKKHKVCLNYHIGRCLGPCQGLIAEDPYQWYVEQVIAFICGKSTELLKELKSRMESLAQEKQFEEAAVIRDQIRSVSIFQSKQKVMDTDGVDRDLITVAHDEKDGCAVVFHIREGKMINRQHFYLKTAGVDTQEILSTFVKQYYLKAQTIPKEVYLCYDLIEKKQIETWLSQTKNAKVTILVPQKGKKARLMAMCDQNAELLLKELQLQRIQSEDKIAGPVRSLQKDLHLTKPPVRIEAFDISTIQGSDSVGSLVVFENGKPKKSEYRKYKIKTVKGPDDFASMAEVFERRIVRLLNEDQVFPDIFLIDGGKGQLSAALSVLKKMGIQDQPIIGLAKRLEEIFIPGIKAAQTLPKSSPSLHLLQRVRDEAHRFAIMYHRSMRQKRTLHSGLDDIPGVGEKRRKALLKTFGSLDGIRSASIEEIAQVPGMTQKMAERIVNTL